MTGLPFGLPPAPGPTPPVTPQQPVMKPTVVPSKVSDMHPYPKDLIASTNLTKEPLPKNKSLFGPSTEKKKTKVAMDPLDDEMSLDKLVRKKVTPDREKKAEPLKHFNPKKAILNTHLNEPKATSNPILTKFLKVFLNCF